MVAILLELHTNVEFSSKKINYHIIGKVSTSSVNIV